MYRPRAAIRFDSFNSTILQVTKHILSGSIDQRRESRSRRNSANSFWKGKVQGAERIGTKEDVGRGKSTSERVSCAVRSGSHKSSFNASSIDIDNVNVGLSFPS